LLQTTSRLFEIQHTCRSGARHIHNCCATPRRGASAGFSISPGNHNVFGTLTAAPLNLSASSTVESVRTAANTLIGNSLGGGTTTQGQAGPMNALLGCLNRETVTP